MGSYLSRTLNTAGVTEITLGGVIELTPGGATESPPGGTIEIALKNLSSNVPVLAPLAGVKPWWIQGNSKVGWSLCLRKELFN